MRSALRISPACWRAVPGPGPSPRSCASSGARFRGLRPRVPTGGRRSKPSPRFLRQQRCAVPRPPAAGAGRRPALQAVPALLRDRQFPVSRTGGPLVTHRAPLDSASRGSASPSPDRRGSPRRQSAADRARADRAGDRRRLGHHHGRARVGSARCRRRRCAVRRHQHHHRAGRQLHPGGGRGKHSIGFRPGRHLDCGRRGSDPEHCGCGDGESGSGGADGTRFRYRRFVRPDSRGFRRGASDLPGAVPGRGELYRRRRPGSTSGRAPLLTSGS